MRVFVHSKGSFNIDNYVASINGEGTTTVYLREGYLPYKCICIEGRDSTRFRALMDSLAELAEVEAARIFKGK